MKRCRWSCRKTTFRLRIPPRSGMIEVSTLALSGEDLGEPENQMQRPHHMLSAPPETRLFLGQHSPSVPSRLRRPTLRTRHHTGSTTRQCWPTTVGLPPGKHGRSVFLSALERYEHLGLNHTFLWVELCNRRFSSVKRACTKQVSQFGECPRLWYIVIFVFELFGGLVPDRVASTSRIGDG